MQELIEHQFFYYPKQQNLCLIYIDVRVLNTRLFSALSLQISPKNAFLLRLRKSKLGHFLSYISCSKKNKIPFKKESTPKLGYISNGKILLFGFDKKNNPIKVYTKKTTNVWEESPFLGFTIIEEYTKREYFFKREYLQLALEKRWKEIESGKDLHGNFTHFNILLSLKKELTFIDNKKEENAKLFDHFYFYSYFTHCLERCTTISKSDVFAIKHDLQKLIKNTCEFSSEKELVLNTSTINTDTAIGLFPSKREEKLVEFRNFLTNNER